LGNTAVVYINVVAPPVSAGDHYAARSGVPLTVGAGAGVLANDRDINSRFVPGPNPPGRLPLAATLVGGPAHGSLGLRPTARSPIPRMPATPGHDQLSFIACPTG
jgi:hypothetical protein